MPSLGDYLGRLLSEITIARMHADLEAVRVAEMYAGHPLLRNMPVPHFRCPTIELNIPVVIKQLEEQPADELPRGAPSLTEMRKGFNTVLTALLKNERIRLTSEQRRILTSVLDKAMDLLAQPREIAIDVKRVADEMSSTASRALTEPGGPVDPGRQQELEEKLKEVARVELLKLRKPPTRLQVLVTTAEIREAGPSDVITRLNLRLTEEAFEWTTIESNGRKRDRLVIE